MTRLKRIISFFDLSTHYREYADDPTNPVWAPNSQTSQAGAYIMSFLRAAVFVELCVPAYRFSVLL